RRLRQLDAAGLAAPAGVDLRLHHHDLGAEAARGALGLGRRGGEPARRHRDPVAAQQLLGLVLVDVHSWISATSRRTCSTEASNSLRSPASSSSSMIRSTPPAPSTQGTPRYRPSTPYSP